MGREGAWPSNPGKSDAAEGGKGATNLVQDVVQRVGTVDGEADEDEIGFRVGQWAQPVVFLLAGGIPQRELDRLTGGLVRRVGDVILEDGRDVFLEGDGRHGQYAEGGRARLETESLARGGWGEGEGERRRAAVLLTYLGEIALAVAD